MAVNIQIYTTHILIKNENDMSSIHLKNATPTTIIPSENSQNIVSFFIILLDSIKCINIDICI